MFPGRALAAIAATICIVALARDGAAAEAPDEAPGSIDVASMKKALAELTGGESRLLGSPGNLEIARKVTRQFLESGFVNGAIRFSAPVFVPGATSITCGELGTIPVEPMYPSLTRPGNFEKGEFGSALVYMGNGTAEDLLRLDGVRLDGAIALMDYECGGSWVDLLQFGIKGFVFIGADDYFYGDSTAKTFNSEVNVPRFFVERAAGLRLKDLCGKKPLPIEVKAAPSVWEHRELSEPWVLVPGADEKLKDEVFVVVAPMDACSVVPGRSHGALSIINLHLLLTLLEDFKKQPPARSVLLVAVNGHTRNFLGERVLSWFLTAPSDHIEQIRDGLAKELLRSRMYAENYGALKLAAPPFDDYDELSLAVDTLWQIKNALVEREAITQDPVAGETGWQFDLASLNDEDLKAAADRMVTSVAAGKGGLFAKLGQTEGDAERLSSMHTKAEAFAAWPIGKLRPILARALDTYHDEVRLEHWRFFLDESSGDRLPVKGRLQNEVKRRLNKVKQSRMALTKYAKVSESERDKLLAELEQQQKDLTKLLILFNKFDIGIGRNRVRYRDIAFNEVQRGILIECRDKLVAQFKSWEERHERQYELDRKNSAIREACGARKMCIVICLDLDGNNDRISFSNNDHYSNPYSGATRGLRKVALDLSHEVSKEFPSEYNPFQWVPTKEEMRPSGGTLDFLSGADSFSITKTPAVALKSAMTKNGLRFSPEDTLDNLDIENVARMHEWLRRFMPALLADESCTLPKNLKEINIPEGKMVWSTRLRSFAMDSLSGTTIPDVPVPDTIIAIYPPKGGALVVDGEVVNVFSSMTDDTGECEIYGFGARDYAVTAYQLDERSCGATHTIDKGRIQTSKQMTSNLTWHTSKTIPMFPCVEFPIYNRYDPTLIAYSGIEMHEFWIKDASSQSEPVKYGVHGAKTISSAKAHISVGPKAFYLWKKDELYEPERGLLITSNKRFALNSTKENPRGEGFENAGELGPNIFTHAIDDMATLNESRVAEMKGVSNRLATDLMAQGRELAKKSAEALKGNRHLEWLRNMWMALGCQAKAQEQVAGMKMDMLKSVVIYMALLLPFCFFLQKLLFAAKRIEHELMLFIGMFVSSYVLFRIIHPAFRVAQNPEAIFIAFVLAAIGCVVTWVLNSYFSTEMALLFNKGGVLGGAEVGNATVGQTAMLLGVQNMRRRRIRTALTTATIVVIVFTMLAFSSVSKTMKPTLLRKDTKAPYSGLCCHWPGGVPVDPATSHALTLLFADAADVSVRRVLSRKDGWKLTFPENEEDKQVMQVNGFIATATTDPVLFETDPVVAGGFSENLYSDEIMISVDAGDRFGVKPADLPVEVTFMGRDMKVVGLFRDRDFALARDLNPNLPLLPLAIKPETGEEGGDKDDEGSLEVDAEDAFANTVPTTELVLMQPGLAEKLGAGVHSISVLNRDPDDPAAVWELSQRLLRVSNAKFFLGVDAPFTVGEGLDQFAVEAGVYYVRNNYRTSIGGLSKLVIPLIIAGSIILNTLLGSVYERKQEIAIYNAIGLNPTHIFLFFLAEALVYSVIGSVGGYLIGQGSAMTMKALGILGNVNINFSSLMVVYAILFTIALVLVSTIYPAYVATRTAVPSGSRKWDMPDHDGTIMKVASPFIYQAKFAPGIMYFLHEFFEECGEASLGDITAHFMSVDETEDAEGRAIYQAEYEVAQAPFDVGVTQKVTVRAQHDELVGSHRMHLILERLTGQDMAWASTNRPFIARMRKLMLRWRNIDPTRQQWYVTCGELLFTRGPDAVFPPKEKEAAPAAEEQSDAEEPTLDDADSDTAGQRDPAAVLDSGDYDQIEEEEAG